jgi:hypothetical protein
VTVLGLLTIGLSFTGHGAIAVRTDHPQPLLIATVAAW